MGNFRTASFGALLFVGLIFLSFLLSLSFALCVSPGPAALSIGFAAAPVTRWLVVRLSVLVVRLSCSRPKVGGFVGWLSRLWACTRLGGCITVGLFSAVFQPLIVQ